MRQQGVTLIELLIVMLIVAVIAAMGGPTLAEIVKRNRLRSDADRVITTLNLTRSEAVKRNHGATACKSSDGTSCSGNWTDGWIVFNDVDADGTLDAGDGDAVVRVFEGLVNGYTFVSTTASSVLTYYPDGSFGGGAGTIRICSADRDLVNSFSVIVSTIGRPRISQGATECP